MEINGLPLHPLVVHAAVVLVPLAALAGWALAFVPSWRWLSRWVALASAVGATVAVVVARLTGEQLLEDRPFLTSAESAVRDTLETHEDRAGVLLVVVVALALVVLVAFWALPAPTGLASGRLDHTGAGAAWLAPTLTVALLALGAAALVMVALTGDAGSRAVWGS